MKFVSMVANALPINMGISDAIVHQDFMDLYANIAYAIHLDLAKMGALMFVMIFAYMEDLQQVHGQKKTIIVSAIVL